MISDVVSRLDWLVIVGLVAAPLAIALVAVELERRRPARRRRRRGGNIDLRRPW